MRSRLLLVLMVLTVNIVKAQQQYVLDTKYPVHDLQEQLMVIADPENTLTAQQLLHDSSLVFMPGGDLPRFLEVGVTYWGKVQLLVADSLTGWTLHFEDRMIGLPAWTKSNGKVDVFAYQDDKLILHKKTGVEYPKWQRDNSPNWVLNQVGLDELPVNKRLTLILKVQGNSIGYPAYFNLSARSPAQGITMRFISSTTASTSSCLASLLSYFYTTSCSSFTSDKRFFYGFLCG